MKTFSFTAVLALATVAVASPVPEAEAAPALVARADQYFTVWTEINFQGTKQTIKNPAGGACYNFVDPFQDTISSAGPTSGLTCTLYENDNCGGRSLTIRNPGVSDLRSVNFNDIASSYRCTY